MDMFISLSMVIISQCIQISKHYMVYLKYMCSFYLSIKLGKKTLKKEPTFSVQVVVFPLLHYNLFKNITCIPLVSHCGSKRFAIS